MTHFHLIVQEQNCDESTLCIQFQEGLSSSISDYLSHNNPSATNLFNLITQCLEEKLSSKTDPNPQGASPSEEGGGPENSIAKNQPVQAERNSPHLSEAEWAHCCESHLCLSCGHPGHFARVCSVKPYHAQQEGNIKTWW